MAPTISVVVTTFNQRAYIGLALESVMAQSLAPNEIVVVDDGSTDGTGEYLSTLGSRIRLVRQPNAGVAAARNTGVRAASGELCVFMDGDDLWAPDRLAIVSDAFASAPDTGLVVTDVARFGASADVQDDVGPLARSFPASVRPPYQRIDAFSSLVDQPFIWTMSQVAIPRAVLDAIGDSDNRFPIGSDYDLYLRIARRYDFMIVGRRLTLWRQVDGSGSGRGKQRHLNWYRDRIRVLAKHRDLADGAERDFIAAACDRLTAETCEFIRYGMETVTPGNAVKGLTRLAMDLRDPAPLVWGLSQVRGSLLGRMRRWSGQHGR